MKEYMEQVRTKTGYVSLKRREAEAEARNFPSLYPENQKEMSSMEEELDNNEDAIVFRNPVEQKDLEIQEKMKQIGKLEKIIQDQEIAVTKAKEKMATVENNLSSSRNKSNVLTQHLSRSKAVVELKLVEKIKEDDFDPSTGKEEIGFEVTTLATLLLDDEVGEITEQEKKKNFFIKMKDKLDNNDQAQMNKLEEVKKLVMDRHTSLRQQRGRRLSLTKRPRSGSEDGERSGSRPRLHE